MGCLIGLIIYAAISAVSFVITAGLTFLICACFGLAWSWKIAIGVWLTLWLLGSVFGSKKK